MSSIYEKYGLKEVINAAGRMTILGVSTPAVEVTEAVNEGLHHYFEMKDLIDKTGAYIAGLLQVESAVVVSCASAGIAQSVAATIVKTDPWLLEHLHGADVSVPREIVLPKGHNVNFGAPVGTMVELGGGKVVEAGYANACSADQLSACVGAETAAILYIKSHHTVQKSMLMVAEAAAVAQRHQVPLIVDAAAEEDLTVYYRAGADLVIYSGAKAIEGPTSGLVIGRQPYVDWVKRQSNGIGRAMKVGKEGILGLTRAIERHVSAPKTAGREMADKMAPFIARLNTLEGVSARVVWDAAGRDIARAEIAFDEHQLGQRTTAIVDGLRNGAIAIYFRGYRANEGKIEVDVRSVTPPQLAVIADCIEKQLGGAAA
ncbi:DgaE family pyridoxal phosphate-dependent ammonia lyase [Martelella alba]|uniref:DgaE family pyridoxal phosphate-dependent ammonia lyase n=1 Tax=Martelella alba TaxID=2590451 RepID=A0ABY2SM71_9HYPH|nr:DgaE family pyridoxal phosphate-dependent ammonia lyase [Martelella alba]TKI06893.1 DgaE family pyridoxal phosphate-dependent ammonia lyase [Martelella alba]